MIEEDADLLPFGFEILYDLRNEECEFCGRSLMSRFGGIVGTRECSSCRADFERLGAAGKLVVV